MLKKHSIKYFIKVKNKIYVSYFGYNKLETCVFSDSPSRYFVIKAGSLKAIEASMSRGAWAFTANTERKLLRAFKVSNNY